MREEHQRTAAYAKDVRYEKAVEHTNRLLAEGAVGHAPPARPILFVAGLPRSGTTLLHQLLAASGAFGYCSNFMARFYRRPALGALAQILATPWLPPAEPSFSSRAGATPGWKEPHEFGYFWESHFPFAEHHQPPARELEALSLDRLTSLVGELEAALGQPLAFKNVILSFVLGRLARELPTMRIVRVRRPRLDVAVSLAAVRRAYFGESTAWFSVRPAATARVLDRPAAEQIAFQIASVEAALDGCREMLGAQRWRDVDYAALCTDPRAVLGDLTAFAGLDAAGLDAAGLSRIPERFEVRQSEDSPESRELADALAAAGLNPGKSPVVRVAVTQANYIPWLGFFDLLDQVDLWVNLDNVQVVSRSFIVRNRVKLLDGTARWLTVALEKAPRDTEICAARLAPGAWPSAHLNVLRENYRGTPHFDGSMPWLTDLLTPRPDDSTLALHNERIVRQLAADLGIAVEVRRASELVPDLSGTPQEKIVEVLRAAGGTSLWNFRRGVEIGLYAGTALAKLGIPLMKQDYAHPSYEQLGSDFLPYLSVLDLILNEGTERALKVIRSGSAWRREGAEPDTGERAGDSSG